MHFTVNNKALNVPQKNTVHTFLMNVNQKNFAVDTSYAEYQVYLSSRLWFFFFLKKKSYINEITIRAKCDCQYLPINYMGNIFYPDPCIHRS